jgi:hypothetical protein
MAYSAVTKDINCVVCLAKLNKCDGVIASLMLLVTLKTIPINQIISDLCFEHSLYITPNGICNAR